MVAYDTEARLSANKYMGNSIFSLKIKLSGEEIAIFSFLLSHACRLLCCADIMSSSSKIKSI